MGASRNFVGGANPKNGPHKDKKAPFTYRKGSKKAPTGRKSSKKGPQIAKTSFGDFPGGGGGVRTSILVPFPCGRPCHWTYINVQHFAASHHSYSPMGTF